MSKVLQNALAKAEGRKEQHWKEREPYTPEETEALMAYACASIRRRLGTRAERKVANKAHWRLATDQPAVLTTLKGENQCVIYQPFCFSRAIEALQP